MEIKQAPIDGIRWSDEPLLFPKLSNWKVLDWNVSDWRTFFETCPSADYEFRSGKFRCSHVPMWERNCDYVKMPMSAFMSKFENPSCENEWLYFDYKHIASFWTEAVDSMLDLSWKCVQFPDKTAKDSTLWIGTTGAHTPCHVDTYGCNFVTQVFGRKRWLLFPPSETEKMKPVRVPYEESSIYSSFNFFRGCSRFPDVREGIVVDLNPGDVLFVPNGWWHYVENLTSAISINVWIPQESDDVSRIQECLVKYFITTTLKEMSASEVKEALNPNEDDLTSISSDQVIQELNWCVEKLPVQSRPREYCSDEVKTSYSIPRSNADFIKSKISVVHNCTVSECKPQPSRAKIELINAFCHPNVIDTVTRKFLENYTILK